MDLSVEDVAKTAQEQKSIPIKNSFLVNLTTMIPLCSNYDAFLRTFLKISEKNAEGKSIILESIFTTRYLQD